MRASLAKVIYRFDPEDMFQSQAAAKNTHDTKKRQVTTASAQMIAEDMPQDGGLNYQGVFRASMDSHLRDSFEQSGGSSEADSLGVVFSSNIDLLDLKSLGGLLDKQMTKRTRLTTPPEHMGGDFCDVEYDVSAEALADSPYILSLFSEVWGEKTQCLSPLAPVRASSRKTLQFTYTAIHGKLGMIASRSIRRRRQVLRHKRQTTS